MYLRHFRLREQPFSLTPDTQFFFDNQSHREVFNTLLLALRHSEGFIKIVGEVGTGKTLLCRKLLASLGPGFISAYIPNPYLTPEELKGFVAHEIGVEFQADTPAYQLLNDIYRRLVELAENKRQVVLVVDEAQAMPRETLEALRLLTNLETEKRKLLQVVLIGQPELDDVLNRPDLRQLKQRIVFSEYLQGITRKSLPAYLHYRLMSAGYAGPMLFSGAAVALLHKASGGVPRLINVMAHKALLAAYGEGSNRVKRRHMERAIADTAESKRWGRWLARRDYWLWPIVGGCSAVLVVGVPRLLGVW
jgi:MSHA biogenesis protein MshM